MPAKIPYHDGLHRLVQIGTPTGLQLVRIVELDEGNCYVARPIEFDSDGQTQYATSRTVTVTNLAEPPDADGTVPADTDAVALDVEGRWIVFLRQTVNIAVFPAKVVSSQQDASYLVREQVVDAQGNFSDKQDAANVTARNLAELSLGPGAALDTGTLVIATAVPDTGSPAQLHYFLDHPTYAKYLD